MIFEYKNIPLDFIYSSADPSVIDHFNVFYNYIIDHNLSSIFINSNGSNYHFELITYLYVYILVTYFNYSCKLYWCMCIFDLTLYSYCS